MSPEGLNSFGKSKKEQLRSTATEESMISAADKAIKLFTSKFEVAGSENLAEAVRQRNEDPERRYVIATSHLSNLDAPAAMRTFGKDFNLQISISSLVTGFSLNEPLLRIAGKKNFSPLTRKAVKKPTLWRRLTENTTIGSFDTREFDALLNHMEHGKTPWIAAQDASVTGKMSEGAVGSIYLAQKSGAYLFPAALEMRDGGSISLEGAFELIKGAVNKAEATYHIGTPYRPDPIDVSIIDSVLERRKKGETVTPEEKRQFSETVAALRMQADELSVKIAEMLPKEMRGAYEHDVPDGSD